MTHPLTLAQLDFWEEFRAHPDVAVSTVAHLTRFEGRVDEQALAHAIRQTIAESDVLALRFHETADGPRQEVDPSHLPILSEIDLRGHAEPEAEARAMTARDIVTPLDLTRGPLAAQWLLRVSETAWFWYCRGHHIFLDAMPWR